MSAPDRGVLYVATGEAHVGAARRSARSVRRTNPGLAIGIFCNAADPGPDFNWTGRVEKAHSRSKVDYIPRSPFAQTLYLDTDTRVLGSLDELFRLLERFDLAIAHVAAPHSRDYQAQWRHDVPGAFPQHNSGVLLYRRRAIGFLEAWRAAYHASGHKMDQITLRDLLWSCDVCYAVLLPRFNTRRYTWLDHWFSRQAKPVILHTNRFHPTKSASWKRRLASLIGPNA